MYLSHELNASHMTDHMSSSNSRVYSFSIYIHPQGGIGGERIHELTPVHKTTKSVVSETPKDVILTSIDQGKQLLSFVKFLKQEFVNWLVIAPLLSPYKQRVK